MEKIISREEIATYLNDFWILMFNAMEKGGTLSFEDAFELTMLKQEKAYNYHYFYYKDMINIAQFFLAKQFFSLWYDEVKDYLKEDNLKELNIPDSIFIDPKDAKRFSNIQKVTYIRNALNHNNNNLHEKYYLKKENDTIFLYIDLLDVRSDKEKLDPNTKPKPFHVKLSPEVLSKIINSYLNAKMPRMSSLSLNNNSPITYENLEEHLKRITIRRYYRRKKIDNKDYPEFMNKVIEIYKNFKSNLDKKEAIKKLQELCDEYGYSYKDYYLTIPQKDRIKSDMEYWKSRGVPCSYALSHEISITSVFSEQRIENIAFLSNFIYENLFNTKTSLNEITINTLRKLLKAPKDYMIRMTNLTSEESKKICNTMDHDNITFSSIILYLSYMFDTMIENDKTTIKDKEYNTENIRNSFVHGRNYIDKFNRIHLLDWDYGTNNIMNKDAETYNNYRIKIDDLLEFSYSYLTDQSIDYPLETYLYEGQMLMYYTKNHKMYYMFEDENGLHLKQRDGTYQETEVEDPNEYDEFIKQIDSSRERINKKYYAYCDRVIEYLKEKKELLKGKTH